MILMIDLVINHTHPIHTPMLAFWVNSKTIVLNRAWYWLYHAMPLCFSNLVVKLVAPGAARHRRGKMQRWVEAPKWESIFYHFFMSRFFSDSFNQPFLIILVTLSLRFEEFPRESWK